MKTKLTLLILVLFAAANFLYSQPVKTTPKDVPGFKQTKWDMTEQEILDAMKGQAIKLKGKKEFHQLFSTVGINDVIIDSNKFVGYFWMNKETQKLFQVNLSITFQHVEDPFEAYESLRKALIKEYGTPLKERSIVKDGSHNKALLWIFPSTSILCSAWGKNLDNFMVQYFKNVGKTPDQFGFREAKTDTTKKVENKK